MLESPLFKRMLIISIFVLASSFYTLIFIPEPLRNIGEMAGIGIIIFVLLFQQLSGYKTGEKQHFKKEIYLLLLAAFFSMFMANAFHNQPFTITLIAQRYIYFFFFYFFLHTIKPEIEDLEKLFLPLAFVYVFLYLTQYMVYPTRIVDSRVGVERGTVRIFIPGGGFLLLAYYMSLQKLLKNYELKYGIYCLIFFVINGILQGTRQSLASIVLLTVAFIFFSKQVKSRTLVMLMAGVAGLAVFILFQDIFLELIAVTRKESTATRENIRLVAVRFFLTEFMPNNLAYIFGNGQDSLNSSFGKEVNLYKKLGLYQSDIGLIGDYTKFGLLFVIAQLSIMARVIFGKLPKEIVYLRYFFISRALVMFTGSNIFSNATGIAFFMIVLYMIDKYKNQELEKNELHEETEENDNKLNYAYKT